MESKELSRDKEIKAIWKEYKFFYQVLGGALLVGIGVFLGTAFFSTPADRIGYLINLYTSILSIGVTIFIIDLLNRRRDEQSELRQEKRRLIRQLASQLNIEARRAAEELMIRGWVHDGSLQGAQLCSANLKDTNLGYADLQDADLEAAKLQHSILLQADLQRANLKFARLQQSCLLSADFEMSNLATANMYETNSRGANFRKADLRGANLQNALLGGANMQGANLYNASLLETNLNHVYFDENTILPDGTKWTLDTDLHRFTDPSHAQFWSAKPDDAGYLPWEVNRQSDLLIYKKIDTKRIKNRLDWRWKTPMK